MNVLSLFDGMSCGRIALERAGIKVNNYFASEIDKHAIAVSKANYPGIIHIGDVTKVSYKGGLLYTESDVYIVGKIDLLIGGSPCQGFSMAGKMLAFDDARSMLYFQYERLLAEIRVDNPDVKFLLENVKMKQEYKDVISERLGVQPIAINSNLVSAQNRYRLYWTNIEGVIVPEDKGIFLKDILQNYQSEWKTYTRGSSDKPKTNQSKAGCLCAGSAGDTSDMDIVVFKEGEFYTSGSGRLQSKTSERQRRYTPEECELLQTVPKGYTRFVSDSQRYTMLGNGWTVDVICDIFNKL